MDKLFQIGSFCFRLICPEEITPPENFLMFAVPEGQPEFTYRLQLVDEVSQSVGTVIAVRPDLLVFEASDGEGRLIVSPGPAGLYGRYEEDAPQSARVLLDRSKREILKLDPGFLSTLVMERRMIEQDALILHCAYIRHQNQAILFSAPSETGKSTQAGLWQQFRGSRTINGDRGLLRKIDGIWHACGWPVCGSSGQCSLGDTPIHAVIMLKQGKVNQVRRLSPIQAFSQIYSQITVNQWNEAFVRHAMSLLEDLITRIPIYELTCDISEDAVRCLESVLFPEDN